MSELIGVEWFNCLESTIGVVLVKDEHEGYKAYIGNNGFTDGMANSQMADVARIRDYGTKLTYEQAKGFFYDTLGHGDENDEIKYNGTVYSTE